MGNDQFSIVMKKIATGNSRSDYIRHNELPCLPGRETTQQVTFNDIIREVDTTLVRSKEWERLA